MPGSPLRQRLWGHWRGAGQFSGVSTCVSVCTTCTRSSVHRAVTAVTLVCEPSSHHSPHPSWQSAPAPGTVNLGTLPIFLSRTQMAYVITDACIRDLLCVDVCPTDCIHPKKRRASLRSGCPAFRRSQWLHRLRRLCAGLHFRCDPRA